uniref:Cysteine-rich PDZ-binding protein n=1 Tax=Timema shepardi TaxID=629360 RepID=A0A7R9AVP0_TIMSH|nr:unnamed protein product [Timema shepardi]
MQSSRSLGNHGYGKLRAMLFSHSVGAAFDWQFTMVCEKCEKKLGRVITPDPWKSGARNTVESGGRKIGENKAITGNKSRFSPYTAKFETCRICRQKVHQVGSHYCQACAYKKGICAMCGKKLLDTKNYKQSSA